MSSEELEQFVAQERAEGREPVSIGLIAAPGASEEAAAKEAMAAIRRALAFGSRRPEGGLDDE